MGKIGAAGKNFGALFQPHFAQFCHCGVEPTCSDLCSRRIDTHTNSAAGRATAAHGPSRQRGCLVHIGSLVPRIWSRPLAQAAPRLARLSSLPASSALLRSSCELCFQRRQQSHSSALPMISWQLHPTMVVGWRDPKPPTALLGRPRPHVARAFIRLWLGVDRATARPTEADGGSPRPQSLHSCSHQATFDPFNE